MRVKLLVEVEVLDNTLPAEEASAIAAQALEAGLSFPLPRVQSENKETEVRLGGIYGANQVVKTEVV